MPEPNDVPSTRSCRKEEGNGMYLTSSTPRRRAGGALAVAAAAIPLQIAGGMDYPVVPPGLIILAVGAAIALFVRPRWALVAPLLIALLLSVGAVVTPNVRDALGEPGEVLAFTATVLQCAGLLVGLVFSVAALAERKDDDSRNALSR
ncbi:hypothetical protein ACQP1W_43870 [Spirillospora sp. CA-255316]